MTGVPDEANSQRSRARTSLHYEARSMPRHVGTTEPAGIEARQGRDSATPRLCSREPVAGRHNDSEQTHSLRGLGWASCVRFKGRGGNII
jgi:hypothetical protein